MTTEEKDELIARIRQAKASHVRWRAYARGAVCMFAVDDEASPIEDTECRFGRWYFGSGMKAFAHLQVFRDVQWPHKMLHALDRQIHDLAEARKRDEAEAKLEQLTGISRALLEQLDLLEREIAREDDDAWRE